MKKIFLSLVFVGFSLSYAQQSSSSDNPFVYEETATDSVLEDKSPGTPGDPAPIDDYIPFLAILGLGLALYYGKKMVKEA